MNPLIARRPISRRAFLRAAFYGTPVVALADGFAWEPEWLKVRHVSVTMNPTHRLVHFTDVHHKGDRAYLTKVIERINSLSPDLVCFTGDIVEESGFLREALDLFGKIKAPLYGIPGNHDYWSNADFREITACFAATGGRWLLDESADARAGSLHLFGSTCTGESGFKTQPGKKNVLLIHYPNWAEKVTEHRFDLMLAGHSHGGQVRIPFYGALLVPFGVGPFEMGLYQTAHGPLYVNPGIGYFHLNVRFCCRPEVTVFAI